MHRRPLTFPITVISEISPGLLRRLSTMAKSAPIRLANSRARATPPTSGEITVTSDISLKWCSASKAKTGAA